MPRAVHASVAPGVDIVEPSAATKAPPGAGFVSDHSNLSMRQGFVPASRRRDSIIAQVGGWWRRVVLIGSLALALGWSVRSAGTLLVLTRPLGRPDAIISLASHEWERLPTTARLAKASTSAQVILTLPRPATVFNCHDCSGRVGRLERLGVSSERVRIIPLQEPGTYGEAVAALTFARETDVQRVVVVTTPYHTRRALAVFRTVFDRSGIEVGIEPAASSPARPDRWWATPYDRAYVAYEWAALVYYAFRYRVVPWRL